MTASNCLDPVSIVRPTSGDVEFLKLQVTQLKAEWEINSIP